MQYLVIGYGNSLRSDDGAGQRVAEAVSSWNMEHVRSIAAHQLSPELAEEISRTDVVIFVDAATSTPPLAAVKLESIAPLSDQIISTHYTDPRTLLALAQTLYQTTPLAYWILIPAANFEFGEQLSSCTADGVKQALLTIQDLIHNSSFNH